MIAFLNGTVAAVLPPQTAYIDVAGVGYAVAMPGGDLGKLAVGEEARVLTYLSVTENGIALFGFLSEEERALFEKLIGVSKVGPKMALAALSTFSPAELADAIASQDIARVSHIPGVGKKTAERIILELKGTLEGGMASLFSQGEVEPARNLAVQGATEALLSMGFTSACASSTHALGEAYRAIAHGYADAIIAGGSEATITEIATAGFANCMALASTDDPDRASIPFDAERSGFVMGEGGACLILEEYEHAKARGAKIYAEFCGYGATSDAFHITAPDDEATQSARAIRMAYEQAGADGSEAVYINAHGTSTPLNDKTETIAIKKALGEELARKAVISRPHAGRRRRHRGGGHSAGPVSRGGAPHSGAAESRSRVRSGLLPQRQAGDVHRPGPLLLPGLWRPQRLHRLQARGGLRYGSGSDQEDPAPPGQHAPGAGGGSGGRRGPRQIPRQRGGVVPEGPLPRQSRGPRGHPL